MLPSALLSYVTQLLALLPFPRTHKSDDVPKRLSLQLRHLHGHTGSRVVFADVPKSDVLAQTNAYSLKTRRIKRHRPRSFESFAKARWRSIHKGESEHLAWDEEEVDGPNVSDRETLLVLAKMTYNAYVQPIDPDWYDLGEGWPDVCGKYLTLFTSLIVFRRSIIHSAGSLTQMASGVMCLQLVCRGW